MKITANTFAFEMSEKEVGVWMTALRLAATGSIGTVFPSESCPFLFSMESCLGSLDMGLLNMTG